MAQDETPAKKWPESAPYTDAIEAFDAALSRAAWDAAFRAELTRSPDAAKAAVAGNSGIQIPDDRVIVFYETQPSLPVAEMEKGARRVAMAAGGRSHSNENIHVFYLPPFKAGDQTQTYSYEEFFMCCYDQWRRP